MTRCAWAPAAAAPSFCVTPGVSTTRIPGDTGVRLLSHDSQRGQRGGRGGTILPLLAWKWKEISKCCDISGGKISRAVLSAHPNLCWVFPGAGVRGSRDWGWGAGGWGGRYFMPLRVLRPCVTGLICEGGLGSEHSPQRSRAQRSAGDGQANARAGPRHDPHCSSENAGVLQQRPSSPPGPSPSTHRRGAAFPTQTAAVRCSPSGRRVLLLQGGSPRADAAPASVQPEVSA